MPYRPETRKATRAPVAQPQREPPERAQCSEDTGLKLQMTSGQASEAEPLAAALTP